MNFLRNSFSSITEVPPPHPPEHDRDASSLRPTSLPAPPLPPLPPLDSDGDYSHFLPPPIPSATDSLRTRNRVPIEDHVDVEDGNGGIVIPSSGIPNDWHLSGAITSLTDLDREFLFPGEQINIVAYISARDESLMPEIITPFKVAALMEKAKISDEVTEMTNSQPSVRETIDGECREDSSNRTLNVNISPISETLLRSEELKKRRKMLLHVLENSHFFIRISETEEGLWRKRKSPGEDLDDGTASVSSLEQRKSSDSLVPVPIIMEKGGFVCHNAGGIARNARCYSFDNGIIAVELQITVGAAMKNDVLLEVLQFEKPCVQGITSDYMNAEETDIACQQNPDSSEQLLQWLLPLDNSSFLSHSTVAATVSSLVNSSSQKLSVSSSASSTLFSFANLRTYSTGSSQVNQTSSIASTQFYSTNGIDESEHLKQLKGQSTSSEGLIAFRGIQLEPQRFSVHCGLEGLYVPGKRWRRKLQIVEPLSVKSYFSDCNTKDLICVHVENIVPRHLPEISVIIDSISIVCETSDPGLVAAPVPIACVEVGGNHKLPGVSLRPGEQHSFVLKPSKSPFHASVSTAIKANSPSISSVEWQTGKASYYSATGTDKKKPKGHNPGTSQDLGNYVLVVSCRCSHSESRLHFKHPIKWQPRSPRDLLLSVSLDSASETETRASLLPSLLPKVVTVQATNLTSESLHLTLLTPSSKYLRPSLPAPAVASPVFSRINSFMSFHEKEWPSTNGETNDPESEQANTESSSNVHQGSLQRSMSLPPARPIESIMGITPRVVKEKTISAADVAAANNSVQTHLWLQSIIPLGSVPPLATTAIKCELLPLTDGIITLDTLHISTKNQEVYYPERPLQIYATSSIGTGIS